MRVAMSWWTDTRDRSHERRATARVHSWTKEVVRNVGVAQHAFEWAALRGHADGCPANDERAIDLEHP